MRKFGFPKNEAFVDAPTRPYKILGQVRTKVSYESLDFQHDEDQLCKNYYNKAVKDLVKRAQDAGGDAVIQVRSVVFYEDEQHDILKTAECSDDGEEGQVLAVGLAVKWLPEPPVTAQKAQSRKVAKVLPPPEPVITSDDTEEESGSASDTKPSSVTAHPNPANPAAPWTPRD